MGARCIGLGIVSMSTLQTIKQDSLEALKSKNELVSSVLRMTLATVISKEKEKRYALSKSQPAITEEELVRASTLTDDEVMSVIISEVKKRKDAISLYEQGGRNELAQREQAEIEVLKKYLPEPLAKEALEALVKESIAVVGATTVKDMGKIMANLMPKVKGKADAKEISIIIKTILQ